MVNWESQSKTFPQSPEDGQFYCIFTYSYCILSCVWKLATSLLVLRHYKHLFLFSMLIQHVTSSRFCLCLLNVYHFTYTFSNAHKEAQHVYNQHTRGMATTQHRSLVERGGRKALLETLHTQEKKCQENPIFTNQKKKIRAQWASSKATRLFLTK